MHSVSVVRQDDVEPRAGQKNLNLVGKQKVAEVGAPAYGSGYRFSKGWLQFAALHLVAGGSTETILKVPGPLSLGTISKVMPPPSASVFRSDVWTALRW